MTYNVEASATIPAPPEKVYSVIADYRNGHPRIVPPAYFKELVVERGGVGAGTIIKVTVKSFGSTKVMRLQVDEPQPGRVLTERDLDNGTLTHFYVEPAKEGGTRVRISTDFPRRPGIAGWMEATFAPPAIRHVFRQELGLLAKVAAE